jgi:hypothetical protein
MKNISKSVYKPETDNEEPKISRNPPLYIINRNKNIPKDDDLDENS